MAPLCFVAGGIEPASSPSPHTKAHAAPTARPVLLVHGFGGTKSSWSVIAQALSLDPWMNWLAIGCRYEESAL
jgi:pimeloyl-ACP methyl ester carboxylesterase